MTMGSRLERDPVHQTMKYRSIYVALFMAEYRWRYEQFFH